jgi:uncharacterized repeat protein (TIGR01451 family)
MFRKIISGVSFSPALVGQLGFYARRLKKEEATRRLGLIFTALALVVQSFIVFAPPESANAASTNDFIYGGVRSKADYLSNYDRNVNNLKTILTSLGITRAEIANTTENRYINYSSRSPRYYSWGRHHNFSYAQGERAYTVYLGSKSKTTTVYARPTALYGNYTAKVMVGKSAKHGWFALMYACGNLVSIKLPPPPPPPPSPSPSAYCSSLSVSKVSDTQRRFTATSKTAYGATISKYSFAVTNSKGSAVTTKSYSSTVSSLTTPALTFAPGSYTVKATVTTSLGNKTSANCQATFTVPTPGVSIEKTVNDVEKLAVEIGQAFTYTLTVKNTGGVTLQNLSVSDASPAGVEFMSADIGTISQNKWSATIASLAPGASKTFSITAKATKAADAGATLVKNTACVETATIPGTNPDDCDDATVEVPETTMSVCELSTDKIVTIKKSAFDKQLHSLNPLDCQKLQVCDLSSNTVVTIRQPQYDETKYSKTLGDCDDMQVCDLSSGEVVVIKQHEYNSDEFSKDASDCIPDVAQSKSALNLTQNSVDATSTKAKADDRIRYTLSVTNVGSVDATANFTEKLDDVLEYAKIIDTGGGSFDASTKTLTWPMVSLKPNETQSRLFTVQLASTIPAAARGTSDLASYDCQMLNTFGNNTTVAVNCPVAKTVESTASELPHTGASENVLFGGMILSIVVYFYARSRQMGKEVRLVRRDINTGTI